jgi:hypothetical protein
MRSGGPHRIATHLRKHNWDIEVLDYVSFFTFDELVQFTESRMNNNLKFIGFSFLWSMWPEDVLKFTAWIKKKYPHIVLIVGASSYSGNNNNLIDYFLFGWSENAIVSLLKYLFSNGEKPIFKEDKIILANEDYVAAPDYNPIIIYEDRDFLHKNEWVSIEFSRGCKFQCAFCSDPFLGIKEDWSRTTESFELQMKDAYDRFGVVQYVVSDDTYNDRPSKLKRFADATEKLNFTPYFSGFVRADLLAVRPADREDLLRMNFIGHLYGIESFNHKAAKSIGKGGNPDKIKEGILDVKKYFKSNGQNLYRGTISLIAGLPHETMESLESTKKWVLENWTGEDFMFYPLYVSDSHNADQHEEKSLISKNFEKYGYRRLNQDLLSDDDKKIIFNSNTIVWENDHLNFVEALKFSKKIYKTIQEENFNIGNWGMTFIPKPIDYTINLKMNARYHGEVFPIYDEEYLFTLNFAKEYLQKKLTIA